MSSYPLMFRVRQTFERPRVDDIPAAVDAQLSQLELSKTIQPGQSVAITAGSRGIANIHLIIKAAVDHLRAIGAEPFIVPAMGSHGGGTAEGQRKIIECYGITESYCGCPIRASMETEVVCEAEEGFPVHFDRHAFTADHVIVCGRVKPHTGFTGDIESGLMKMMLIGLGKHAGAKVYHRAIKDNSFGQIVRSVAREVLSKCRIAAGLAIIENGYDETAKIAAVAPSDFEEREKELLVEAKQWMPRLPFKTADLLLIDEIGKNISGTGMDTNIVGRKYRDHIAREDEFPKVRYIAIRGLTK
ncbi:MAG: lactate racemase domain-containing protein, partial [Pirellulaceae bacterium]|nr:lactate racemase domain-containing protein [Pirellulaceae bacterium]